MSAEEGSSRSRWSLFAAPAAIVQHTGGASPATSVHRWRDWSGPAGGLSHDPVVDLERCLAVSAGAPEHHPDPIDGRFCPGWIGVLSYELGGSLEPVARGACGEAGAGFPLWTLVRIDGGLLHDRHLDEWWVVGDQRAAPDLDPVPASVRQPGFGTPGSTTGRARYLSDVRAALEHIRAGNVFQANLSHDVRLAFSGSPRAAAASLIESMRPAYGAYIEFPSAAPDDGAPTPLGGAVCTLSPELLVEIDAGSGRIETRPIKGTRRGDGDPAELLLAEKDRAELNMIVDLMRNDLGRVCRFGSVRVESVREIERYAGGALGVLHAVATVSGTLRAGMTPIELLRAVFPAGSITGAPKIRAMQIIDSLEQRTRGGYCGSIGYVGDSGDAAWNVAIRTATLQMETDSTAAFADGRISFPVGAGIVSDSDPESEWLETLDKARAFLGALGHNGSLPDGSIAP